MRGIPAGRQYEAITRPIERGLFLGGFQARVEITEGSTISAGPTFNAATREEAVAKAAEWCRQNEADIKARRSQAERHRIDVKETP